MKKTIADLEEIRSITREQMSIRRGNEGINVVVGMGTCGIAAGARQVMLAFITQLRSRHIDDVCIRQTGCMGRCQLEPMVEIYVPGQEKVTYVNVTPDMVGRIVEAHIINGKPIKEYTLSAAE